MISILRGSIKPSKAIRQLQGLIGIAEQFQMQPCRIIGVCDKVTVRGYKIAFQDKRDSRQTPYTNTRLTFIQNDSWSLTCTNKSYKADNDLEGFAIIRLWAFASNTTS